MRRFLALVGCLAMWACGEDAAVIPPPAATSTSAGSGGEGSASSATSSSGNAAGGATSGAGGSAPSCREPGLGRGEHAFTIAFDGNRREYEVAVPASYDGSVAIPLVFDFHGYTSDKDGQQLVSGIAAQAEMHGFAVVRVNGFGVLRSWNAGDFCCGTAQSQGLDDVGLVRAIAAEVTAALCVDPARIYATGLSNGGAMSHRLACEAADLFAAVAPVSYPLDFDPFDQCQPSRPIAVMHSHGYGDGLVPYEDGLVAADAQDSFAYWAQVNGCSGTPETTYENDNSLCETYTACQEGVKVSLCSIDGGHVLYNNADGVPVAELVWEFLSGFTLP
jgi:polyhydroxybutyrate depolymerase